MQERFKGGVAAVWGGNRYRANAMRGETEEKRGEAARPFAGCFGGATVRPQRCAFAAGKIERWKSRVCPQGGGHTRFSV